MKAKLNRVTLMGMVVGAPVNKRVNDNDFVEFVIEMPGYKGEPEQHQLTVWSGKALEIAKALYAGQEILADGRLRSRKREHETGTFYNASVTVYMIEVLSVGAAEAVNEIDLGEEIPF